MAAFPFHILIDIQHTPGLEPRQLRTSLSRGEPPARRFVYSWIVIALDTELEFDAENDESFFASIPERPGVFLIELRTIPDSQEREAAKPYLSRTADLRRAAERLLRSPDGISKRLNLRSIAKSLSYRATGSRLEQSLVLYQHARQRFPRNYRSHLRIRPPALLKINLRNPYPRCYVTRRVLADGGYYFGPFASRKFAETFAEGFLDLFNIRRCQIKIRRDPEFPGCIYSEMKMCLAPCFAGCTKQEYDVEVGRVISTLESKGASLTRGIESEREAASEALDFEKAGNLHKKLEKVGGVLRGVPELARRIESLDAVIIQKACAENSVAIFRIGGGHIVDPIILHFDEHSSQPRSVEENLRHEFELADAEKRDAPGQADARIQEEHLALLARWYYSNPRAGEILFRDGDWPYRRILRACARVLSAENRA